MDGDQIIYKLCGDVVDFSIHLFCIENKLIEMHSFCVGMLLSLVRYKTKLAVLSICSSSGKEKV